MILKLLTYLSKTASQRTPTADEIKERSQYINELLQVFEGHHLKPLFFHKFGCKVINGIYFSKCIKFKEKRRILSKIMIDRKIALTRPEPPGSISLRTLLTDKELPQEERATLMSHLVEIIDKLVDKEMLDQSIVHFVLHTYCEFASDKQMESLVEDAIGAVPHLLASKPGAEAALRILGFASAKQKKVFCHDVKGKFTALAMNSVNYVVMIRLLTTVDDTKMLGSTVIDELIPDMKEIVFSKYGHKVLAWVLMPSWSRIFSPYDKMCATLPSPKSLKSADTRRAELLRKLKPPIHKVLMDAPATAAADCYAKNVLLSYLATDWDHMLLENLLGALEAEKENDDLGLLDDKLTTMTLRALLELEPEGQDPGLAVELYQRCFEARLKAIVTSRSVFALSAIVAKSPYGLVANHLRAREKEISKAIKDAEEQGLNVKAARALLDGLKGE